VIRQDSSSRELGDARRSSVYETSTNSSITNAGKSTTPANVGTSHGRRRRRTALVPGFHIPRVRWMTGQNKVPALSLDGKVIFGSANIISALERLQPDPPLFPRDDEERVGALALQSYFDDEVAPDLSGHLKSGQS
jgi:hypothetical protein